MSGQAALDPVLLLRRMNRPVELGVRLPLAEDVRRDAPHVVGDDLVLELLVTTLVCIVVIELPGVDVVLQLVNLVGLKPGVVAGDLAEVATSPWSCPACL